MVRTAIQLYTLRALDEPLPALLRRVGETGFDGVEFAGFGETSPETAAAVLEETRLDAAACHVGIDRLESDLDEVNERCDALGCEHVVVPHLDGPFDAEAGVSTVASRLSEAATRLENRGRTLGYHNHDHEFVPLDDRSGYDRLIESVDETVRFELDVGWAAAAGHDPVSLLRRLDGRVPLVHVKDVRDGRPVELGDGEVDLDRCVAAALDAGVEWLVYEHDDPPAPAESLARGAQVLDELRADARA